MSIWLLMVLVNNDSKNHTTCTCMIFANKKIETWLLYIKYNGEGAAYIIVYIQ